MKKSLTIKDFIRETRLFNQRIAIICLIILLLITGLIYRFAYLQIQQHKLYTTLSWQNQMRLIPITPNRGLIYDRNGKLLAENLPVFSLYIFPDHIKNIKKTIARLQKIIPINQTELEQFYKSLKQHPKFIPVTLKVKLTQKQISEFYVNRYRFPGVIIQGRMLRYYSYGKALANVVGYVGRITAEDLQKIDSANYSASNYLGKTGIEQYYEKELHGKVGYQQVEIDASGRTVRTLKRISPTPGKNLYLTVDADLQIAAAKAMGDEHGAIVVIQPNTGQVLAMVSNPSYNPNVFVMGLNTKDYNQLLHNPAQPLFNRAIRGQYPIGSTIKPFLALEGLDTNVITPKTTIFDPGWYRLPNAKHIYHDWRQHNYVNVTKAIIVSCDTFFYQLGVAMGINKIDDILDRFGFGRATGIDMNGELQGLLPNPRWKLKKLGYPWYEGDVVNTSIGQGYFLATPLQLADATAALSERGTRYKPFLLLNEKPTPFDPVMLMHNKYWDVVINAMKGVIFSTKPFGTGGYRFGRHPGYTIAAKTGTAQVYKPPNVRAMPENEWPKKYRNDSLFIAFAPIKNPQIAIAIVVEHSDIASPIARKIMDYYLVHEKHIALSKTPIQYFNPLAYPNENGDNY